MVPVVSGFGVVKAVVPDFLSGLVPGCLPGLPNGFCLNKAWIVAFRNLPKPEGLGPLDELFCVALRSSAFAGVLLHLSPPVWHHEKRSSDVLHATLLHTIDSAWRAADYTANEQDYISRVMQAVKA